MLVALVYTGLDGQVGYVQYQTDNYRLRGQTQSLIPKSMLRTTQKHLEYPVLPLDG